MHRVQHIRLDLLDQPPDAPRMQQVARLAQRLTTRDMVDLRAGHLSRPERHDVAVVPGFDEVVDPASGMDVRGVGEENNSHR
jgi:hypothetical protein